MAQGFLPFQYEIEKRDGGSRRWLGFPHMCNLLMRWISHGSYPGTCWLVRVIRAGRTSDGDAGDIPEFGRARLL
jgi:hypothetical protein